MADPAQYEGLDEATLKDMVSYLAQCMSEIISSRC